MYRKFKIHQSGTRNKRTGCDSVDLHVKGSFNKLTLYNWPCHDHLTIRSFGSLKLKLYFQVLCNCLYNWMSGYSVTRFHHLTYSSPLQSLMMYSRESWTPNGPLVPLNHAEHNPFMICFAWSLPHIFIHLFIIAMTFVWVYVCSRSRNRVIVDFFSKGLC